MDWHCLHFVISFSYLVWKRLADFHGWERTSNKSCLHFIKQIIFWEQTVWVKGEEEMWRENGASVIFPSISNLCHSQKIFSARKWVKNLEAVTCYNLCWLSVFLQTVTHTIWFLSFYEMEYTVSLQVFYAYFIQSR